MGKQTFVIVGGVAAGMSAASRIRGLKKDAEILVFERSNYVSYAACGMPYLIEGKVSSSKDLVVYDSRFFKEKRSGILMYSFTMKLLKLLRPQKAYW